MANLKQDIRSNNGRVKMKLEVVFIGRGAGEQCVGVLVYSSLDLL